ncbi:uridine monophosphate kinase [Candidatus Bipolaricaulota bacterium]|nr:uridine monophosphate kinase [Candidatus Bipolaricaulota bacterium]
MVEKPKRILLKLSGEALKGENSPFSPFSLQRICAAIASVPVEWAIVVGAGNLIRGARSPWLDRVEADTMGMLATVLNALAVQSCLVSLGKNVLIQSAVDTQLTRPVSPRHAQAALAAGTIVIFAGGTGSPLVTTDTAAAIRAVSIEADLLIKGSNVNGVYDGDPSKDRSARLIEELSYDDFLAQRYGVMDQVAVEICREHGMPIEVFNLEQPDALASIASGTKVGTRIR